MWERLRRTLCTAGWERGDKTVREPCPGDWLRHAVPVPVVEQGERKIF